MSLALKTAAAVLEAFPPRGGIRFLPPEATAGGRSEAERFVIEEYIIDVIHFWDGNRVACAKLLSGGEFCTEYMSLDDKKMVKI